MMGRAAVLAAVLTLSGSRALAGVEGAKLYTGPDGIQVRVVRVSGMGDTQALVLVQGSDGILDGKALPYVIQEEGRRTRYQTQVDGKNFYPFQVEALSDGTRTYTLYGGGNRGGVKLVFDEKGSASVKGDEVVKRYEQGNKDGSLAKFQTFDRPRAQRAQEAALQGMVVSTRKGCGLDVPVTVAWKSISDEALQTLSVASYCGAPLEAMQKLCEFPSVRAVLASRVKRVDCGFGTAAALEVKDGTVHWTTSSTGSNLEDFAVHAFEQQLAGVDGAPAKADAKGALQAPWHHGTTLGDLKVLDQSTVCTDGKEYFVVVAPAGEKDMPELYSGDGKKLTAARPAPWGLPGTTFFDPRFPNPTSNANFRGSDMRVHSDVNVEKATCTLRCGTRALVLKILDPAKARALLLAATLEENPQSYAPHALLRDDHGRYYYVDKGIRKDNEKSFRVFIGNKGKLDAQKLTNLVADSEGEVFSTKKGDLRLVVDRTEGSTWMQAGKRTTLRAVPLSDNLPLIYNELGVYAGARLGTPCDDASF